MNDFLGGGGTFVVLRPLVELLIIPFLLWKYGLRATNRSGSRWSKWGYKNPYIYALLVFGSGAVLLEGKIYSADRPRHKDVELEFFLTPKYNAELDRRRSADLSWSQTKTVLLRKFEHAEYAWHHKDYKEAVDMLVVIKAGQDAYGNFAAVPSYVIANDLGCASFKLQRNKAFASETYFQEAKTLVPTGSPDAEIIERNMQLLDQMVNTLD